jgi:hypothetical protein
MIPEKFDALLDMVAPKIERQNTQNEGYSITTSDVGSDLVFYVNWKQLPHLAEFFQNFEGVYF